MKLRLRVAGADVVEVAAGVLPLLDQDVAAEEQCRHQPLAESWVVVDALADQLPKDEASLRMADQDEWAPMIELREVLLPRGKRAGVRDLADLRRGRAPEEGLEGDLPVHGCEHPALLRVAGRLVERDRAFLRVDREIAVVGLVVADGRID